MEVIQEKLEDMIEKIEDQLLDLDPKSQEYKSLVMNLNNLIDRRNRMFVSEMMAVEKNERSDLDRKKVEKELELQAESLKIERRKSIWEPFKTILPVGVTAFLALTGMKIETEDHVILNHDVKKWIPNIKIPFQ